MTKHSARRHRRTKVRTRSEIVSTGSWKGEYPALLLRRWLSSRGFRRRWFLHMLLHHRHRRLLGLWIPEGWISIREALIDVAHVRIDRIDAGFSDSNTVEGHFVCFLFLIVSHRLA